MFVSLAVFLLFLRILIRDFDLNSLFPHAADRKKKSGCRVGRVNHQPDTPLRGNNYKLLIACERY